MPKEYRMLIQGQWLPGPNRIEVRNKYSNDLIGMVPQASREDVNRAIDSAVRGLELIRHMPAHERSKILERTSRLIEANQTEIASLIAMEAGKAFKYAIAEVKRGAETFKFAADEARQIHGETIPMDASQGSESRIGFYLRFPVGLIAAISPFNFPLNLVAHKVAPAIAAGNSLILKPATTTPLTALRMAELLMEAGLPDGVLNIVMGSGSTVGEWLITDSRINMVTFTGSPPVGRSIMSHGGLKKYTMELGSNSAVIVCEDADIGRAIPRCVTGSFANSGQICISVQLIYVHRSILQEFTDLFVEATRRQVVGDPLDESCDVGPMIDIAEAERVEKWVDEAVAEGARILTGGQRNGVMYAPTVLTDVRPAMKVVSDELFGPVVSIIPYDDFTEVLNCIERSKYGLQTGIYTQHIGRAFQTVKGLNVGSVIINDVPTYRADHMPYGGNKESGIGREGVKFAIEEMTNIRMICFNL